MRPAVLVFVVALSVTAGAQRAAAPKPAQTPAPKPPAAEPLEPLSYVCTMPGDENVLEDKPGVCPNPKCGMKLVPVRLVSKWSCATNTAFIKDGPGKCPTDGSDLVRVTVEMTFGCPGTKDLDTLEPGKCPDGAPKQRKYAARAHGNHNPQHGGQFFMAPDSWHHIEGVYLPSGAFRLYLYDDFTKPLKAVDARPIAARLVTKQVYDPSTGKENEIEKYALVRKGSYLEASIGQRSLPARMSAKVTFKAGDKENLFDFTFDAFSKDPAAPKATAAPVKTTAAAAKPGTTTAAKPAPGAPAATPDPNLVELGVNPALIAVPIPETVPEMLAQLRTRSDQIRQFIDKGEFAAVYVPAFQAKDLALALDEHRRELSVDKQRVVEPAVQKVVRSAYMLDAFGDLGNKQQILEAYAIFTAAVKDIQSAFPEK
ncbi:MAG: hypothetical protein LAO77_03555 [Acidobacteriia bacterium]|nr:hypothetical protein [Terriglobia bacterium]